MHDRVSMPASLGDLTGRGYLSVQTEGYRRAEGVFFTELAHRDTCLRYIIHGLPALYRGVLVDDRGIERIYDGEVFVRAVGAEGGRLRVRLEAIGSF